MTIQRRSFIKLSLLATAVVGFSASAAFAANLKIALVLPGSVTDGGWNQGAYQGLEALKRDGYDIAFSENVSQANIPQVVRGYADDGYDLVIGHGFQFGSLFAEIGPDYPKQKFFATTSAPGGSKVPDNVMYIDFRYSEVAYGAGALAAFSSPKKSVGMVGGGDNPTTQAMAAAFKEGASKEGVKANVIITGDYNDAAKGREAATTLTGNGADVIWHTADLTGVGAVQGAAAAGAKVIGCFADQTQLAPAAIITSFSSNNAGIVGAVAKMVKDGTFAGGKTWAPRLDFLWLTAAGDQAFNTKVADADATSKFKTVWASLADGQTKPTSN